MAEMINHCYDATNANSTPMLKDIRLPQRTANLHAKSEDKCAKFIEAAVWMARSSAQWRRIKRGQSSQALGKSVGGFIDKANICVDALGNPLRFILTGGEKPDITQAAELIDGLESQYAIVDRGYDAYAFRWRVIERGAMPAIPPRRNVKRRMNAMSICTGAPLGGALHKRGEAV